MENNTILQKRTFFRTNLYKHNRKCYIYLKEGFKYTKKISLLEKKVLFPYQSFINEMKVIKSLTAFHRKKG